MRMSWKFIGLMVLALIMVVFVTTQGCADSKADAKAVGQAAADAVAEGGKGGSASSEVNVAVDAAPIINIPAQTNFNDVLVAFVDGWIPIAIVILVGADLAFKAFPNARSDYGMAAKEKG